MTIGARPGGYKRPKRRVLTKREADLVNAVMSGATTNSDMAEALGVKPCTIKTMLEHIYLKTDSRNVADLILWRIRQCG